jgi:hypothetical protein
MVSDMKGRKETDDNWEQGVEGKILNRRGMK